jgi:hypothetical protein
VWTVSEQGIRSSVAEGEFVVLEDGGATDVVVADVEVDVPAGVGDPSQATAPST